MNKDFQIGAGDLIKFKKHGEVIVGKGKVYCGMTIQELENRFKDKILKVERPTKYTVTFEKNEILDEVEKRYLRAVIRPFKGQIKYIRKTYGFMGEYIDIELTNDNISFPYFETNTMYKGMKIDKHYTLKELGLYE